MFQIKDVHHNVWDLFCMGLTTEIAVKAQELLFYLHEGFVSPLFEGTTPKPRLNDRYKVSRNPNILF
jgi:hypothetical protein